MMASSPEAQVFTRVEEKMCTFAAKRLTAVILVEWNWNCTGVETYPVSAVTRHFFPPGPE